MRITGTHCCCVFLLGGLLFGAAIGIAEEDSESSEPGIIPAEELAGRYQRLAEAVGESSLVVLFGKEAQIRSNDTEWPLKQANEIFYYTGLHTPGTAFALLQQGGSTYTAIFTNLGSPEHETWVGRLPSAETIKEWTGVDHVGSVDDLDWFVSAAINGGSWQAENDEWWREPRFLDFYNDVLDGKARLWMHLGRRRRVSEGEDAASNVFVDRMATNFPEFRMRNITPFIHNQMEVKSEWEIGRLEETIDITVEAHKAAMERAATADHEYQLEATIEYVFRDRGACCWAFPSIVASGDSGTILHYNTNNAPIERDKLVLVDIGAEVDGYAADITRTFPASGRFTDIQRDIYEAVADVQREMVESVAPGVSYGTLATRSTEMLGERLLELGLIEENTREQVRLYYFHGLSHTLGMDVHDVWEPYRDLRPGMVITVEPGIYVRKKQVLASSVFKEMSEEARVQVEAALEVYDWIGVRIEDDVLVTSDGQRNLSEGAPRTVEAIEAFMASGR